MRSILGDAAQPSLEAFEDYSTKLGDLEEGDQRSVNDLLRAWLQEDGDIDSWSFGDFGNLLENGVYSPFQLALAQIGRAQEESTVREFPFCFSLIGKLLDELSTTLDGIHGGDPEKERLDGPEEWAQALQTVFYLRETREEGEHPSIEMISPSRGEWGEAPDIPLQVAGQIFGRGVAMVSMDSPKDIYATDVSIERLFEGHEGTPSSLLYELERPFDHLNDDEISIILRRDQHVTISIRQNPVLEFYDGGWSIVDLEGAEAALSYLFDTRFENAARLADVREKILHLTYHMATHWHSGIIAVIDEDGSEALEDENKPALHSEVIPEAVKAEPDGGEALRKFDELTDDHRGRVLLTNAIQDGAMIVLASGEYDSAGRMVKRVDRTVGGAGTRAANALAEHGVALKVSEDGSVKVFARDEDGNLLVPEAGLRIH